MLQRIYGKFMTQLRASIWEEISDIKEEGNLEAVMNCLDKTTEKHLGDPVESHRTQSSSPKLHSQRTLTTSRFLSSTSCRFRRISDFRMSISLPVSELHFAVPAPRR
ncbi:hypothetical protein A6R68_01530, partial [Neotoma lepida]